MSASLGDRYRLTSKPFTLAATLLRSRSVGNSVMNPTPDRPASSPSQNVATSLPSGLMTPSPVTTTRRRISGVDDFPGIVRGDGGDVRGHEALHIDGIVPRAERLALGSQHVVAAHAEVLEDRQVHLLDEDV